jgi:hypothetical protein
VSVRRVRAWDSANALPTVRQDLDNMVSFLNVFMGFKSQATPSPPVMPAMDVVEK